MKPKIIPPVLFLAGLLLIIISWLLIPSVNLIRFPYNLSGVFFMLTGFILNSQAYELFKKNSTPHSFEVSTKLIHEGIFKHTRNPMYLGMFLVLLGFAVCFQNIVSIMIPFIFILIVRMVYIPFEEKRLSEIFGNDYNLYKKQVRRWI